MTRKADMTVKVTWGWREVALFRWEINRHNRRKFRKLSQIGKLYRSDLPYFIRMMFNDEGRVVI